MSVLLTDDSAFKLVDNLKIIITACFLPRYSAHPSSVLSWSKNQWFTSAVASRKTCPVKVSTILEHVSLVLFLLMSSTVFISTVQRTTVATHALCLKVDIIVQFWYLPFIPITLYPTSFCHTCLAISIEKNVRRSEIFPKIKKWTQASLSAKYTALYEQYRPLYIQVSKIVTLIHPHLSCAVTTLFFIAIHTF